MHINLEKHAPHSVQSYSDTQVTVNHIDYQRSLIINKNTLIPDWNINKNDLLDTTHLQPLLDLKPELILIGHNVPRLTLPPALLEHLFKHRIGIECMPLGAACRTFNVLLNEERAVVFGIIF